jgi:hypothetical protein
MAKQIGHKGALLLSGSHAGRDDLSLKEIFPFFD